MPAEIAAEKVPADDEAIDAIEANREGEGAGADAQNKGDKTEADKLTAKDESWWKRWWKGKQREDTTTSESKKDKSSVPLGGNSPRPPIRDGSKSGSIKHLMEEPKTWWDSLTGAQKTFVAAVGVAGTLMAILGGLGAFNKKHGGAACQYNIQCITGNCHDARCKCSNAEDNKVPCIKDLPYCEPQNEICLPKQKKGGSECQEDIDCLSEECVKNICACSEDSTSCIGSLECNFYIGKCVHPEPIKVLGGEECVGHEDCQSGTCATKLQNPVCWCIKLDGSGNFCQDGLFCKGKHSTQCVEMNEIFVMSGHNILPPACQSDLDKFRDCYKDSTQECQDLILRGNFGVTRVVRDAANQAENEPISCNEWAGKLCPKLKEGCCEQQFRDIGECVGKQLLGIEQGVTIDCEKNICVDINECKLGIADCDQYCTNVLDGGGYTCSCKEGYTLNLDGKTCDDINECSENTHNCDDNALCSNTEGGFACTCKPGYIGDGLWCCREDNFPCCASPTNQAELRAAIQSANNAQLDSLTLCSGTYVKWTGTKSDPIRNTEAGIPSTFSLGCSDDGDGERRESEFDGAESSHMIDLDDAVWTVNNITFPFHRPRIIYPCVFDGAETSKMFDLDDAHWTFKNIIFKKGTTSMEEFNGGAAIDVYSGVLNLDECDFVGNNVESIPNAMGGAVKVWGTTLTATGCTFIDNKSPNKGGALYIQASTATIENCYFERNESSSGGAVYLQAATCTFSSSEFVDNTANIYGRRANDVAATHAELNCAEGNKFCGGILKQYAITGTCPEGTSGCS